MWRHRPSLAHRHTSRAGPADRGLSVDRGLCAKSCRHLSVHGARRSHSYCALQRPRLSPSLLPEPTSLTFGCHLASSPGPELVTTSKWRTLLTATAGPLRMESQCRRCLASCPLPEREGKALQEKDVLGSTCHCGTVRPSTGPPPQPARLLHHSRLIWEIMSPGSGNRVQTG